MSAPTPRSADEQEILRRLGEKLRQARKRRGWSLHDAAEASEGRFSPMAIGTYERGDRAVGVARLVQLADLYAVPVAALLPVRRDDRKLLAVFYDDLVDEFRARAEEMRSDGQPPATTPAPAMHIAEGPGS